MITKLMLHFHNINSPIQIWREICTEIIAYFLLDFSAPIFKTRISWRRYKHYHSPTYAKLEMKLEMNSQTHSTSNAVIAMRRSIICRSMRASSILPPEGQRNCEPSSTYVTASHSPIWRMVAIHVYVCVIWAFTIASTLYDGILDVVHHQHEATSRKHISAAAHRVLCIIDYSLLHTILLPTIRSADAP